MYQHNKLQKPKRGRKAGVIVALILAVVLIVGVGVWVVLRALRDDTSVRQSASVTTKIATSRETYKTVTGDGYSMKIPADWGTMQRVAGNYNINRWQSPTSKGFSRTIDVYVGTIPTTFAVNRVYAVEANGAALRVVGPLSDNCATFTKGKADAPGPVGTPAKWQDVEFLCDLANPDRQVVGISAPGSLNKVTLTSPSGASRPFFLSYTDNDVAADFTPFTVALNSFQAL